MTRRTAERGFSLIETLVALAVIAGMTGLFFETVGVNARFAADLTRRRSATMLAQSLLAQAMIAPGPKGLAEQGRAHGLSWHVTRLRRSGGARDSAAPLEEVRIDVVDPSTGRRLTTVRTLRLVR